MAGEVAGEILSLAIEITAVPATFGTLANQIDTGVNGSIVAADATSKSSGGIVTSKALQKNINITSTYNPDPTDQAHIDLLAHFEANPMTTFDIELTREDGTGKITGAYGIVNFGEVAPVGGLVTYSLELAPLTGSDIVFT